MASINSGLGGTAGYGEGTFSTTPKVAGGNDDGSVEVDISSVFGPTGINAFGTNYSSIYINSNGVINFGAADTSHSGDSLSDLPNPSIAVFWTDHDINNGGEIYWDLDPNAGTVTITWHEVAPYGGSGANTYQIVLTATGNGDADVELIYENIDWHQSGGTSAITGVTDGGSTHLSLEGSGDPSALVKYDGSSNENTEFDGTFDILFSGGTVSTPNQIVEGSAGNDNLILSVLDADGEAITTGADSVLAGAGNDYVDANEGADTVHGGEGSDTILGGTGNDEIHGDGLGPESGSTTTTITASNFSTTGAGYTVTARNVENGALTSASTSNVSTTMGGFGAGGRISDSDSGVSEQTGFDLASGLSEQLIVDFDNPIITASFSYKALFTTNFGEQAHWAIYDDGSLVAQATFREQDAFDGSGTIDLSGYGSFDQIVFTGLPQTDATDGSDFLITGITFDSTPSSSANNDSLLGGDGFDEIYGGQGADTITGDAGDDTIFGEDGNDNIAGGIGDDSVLGGAGADTISGGEGNDYIEGGEGDDLLSTGIGDDTLVGGQGNDTLMNSSGDDSLVGGTGDDSIVATGGEDTLRGGTGADTMEGGDDADTFIIEDGFGNDVITGGEGTTDSGEQDFDVIDLTALSGPVTVTYDAVGAESGTITNGTDTITFSEIEQIILSDQAESIDASNSQNGIFGDTPGINADAQGGDDTVTGGRGGDTIQGGAGADSIEGRYGDDSLAGGSGNDTIFGDGSSGQGNDTIEGGQGDDYIDGGVQSDTLLGGTGQDSILGGDGDDSIEGGDGDDTLSGGADNDTLIGGDGKNRLYGDAGDDSLVGMATDVDGFSDLVGGAGADTLDGSAGDYDIAQYYSSATGVNIDLTDGSAESGGDAQGDSLIGIEQINGSNTGNDTIVVDSNIAMVAGWGGNDDLTLDATTGSRAFGGDGADTVTGGAGADTIQGDSGNDSLLGGVGNDQLDGGTGDDTLIGGDGADTIAGGDGDDLIEGGAGDDLLTTGLGQDTLLGGDGNDTLMNSDGDDSLDGGAGDDSIVATGGEDTLRGGTGADTMEGGDDADTFIIEDGFGNDVITGGEGTTDPGDTDFDTIDLSALSGPVTVTYTGDEAGTITDGTDTITFSEIEDLILTDHADVVTGYLSTPDAEAQGIEIFGGDGDDSIEGTREQDTLKGGNDDDTIDGWAGADSIEGGAGRDDLAGGEGDDTVHGGINGDRVSGWLGDDSLFGDAGQDTLVGGEGDDHIEGGDDEDKIVVSDNFGNDTIIGGEGGGDSDTIDLSNVTSPVTVTYTSDEAGTITNGTDTITFSEIERIVLTDQDDNLDGTATADGIDIDGRAGNDSIRGGDGNDTLVGGTGNDSLYGGSGADSITAGDNDDVILGGAGNDTIDGGDGDDDLNGSDGDDSLVGGGGNDSLYAGADNDTLLGDAGDDELSGWTGNDSLDGGSGADTLYGGEGDDTVLGGADDDLIYDWSGNDSMDGGDGADTILVFDGFGNDTVVGGEGGSDDDTLDLSALSGPVTVTYTSDEAGTITDGTDTISFSEIERIITTDHDDVVDADSQTGTTGINVETGAGKDSITGSDNADTIDGGGGNDTIFANSGDDTITGGTGDDSIEGGGGDDVFVYSVGDGQDTITDFNSGNSGALGDGDTENNDFIDLSSFYDNLTELREDFNDDGVLNQSNSTANGGTVDYSDNSEFQASDGLTFQGADQSSFRADNTGVVCFTSGTAIRTPQGEMLIENLRIGDLVSTLDNGPQRICWIGQTHIDHAALLANPRIRPVVIKKGVLGTARDLLISPQHCMLVDPNTLARATHLVKTHQGIRVAQGKRRVSYYHLLFETHQIIFAESAASESFYPGPIALQMLGTPARDTLSEIMPWVGTNVTRAQIEKLYGPPARRISKKLNPQSQRLITA